MKKTKFLFDHEACITKALLRLNEVIRIFSLSNKIAISFNVGRCLVTSRFGLLSVVYCSRTVTFLSFTRLFF